MSMQEYKAGNAATNNPTAPGNSGNKFTTAAGYEMEKGAYRSGAQGIYDKYEEDSNGEGGGLGRQHIGNFDKDGYLSYDSTKYQIQNNTALKEAGYKAGDMLWKPGAKDDLNGRELTGRIARISASGNYIPEYVNDAINSSHQSTGNAGYQGEVGLGADQAAYNRQYEQENDVYTGQYNQQAEANGLETIEGTNQYGYSEGTKYAGGSSGFYDEGGGGFDGSQQSPSYMPNMRLPSNSAAEAAGMASNMSNPWSYDQNVNPFKNTKKTGIDFNFNPGRFMQGQ